VAEGVLTEIRYPLVDRIQTRDTHLIIRFADGHLLDEREDFEHKVEREPGTLSYKVISRGPAGRIEKRIAASPDKDVLFVEYEIFLKDRQPYEVILIHNPACEGTWSVRS
jgi:hypothetical protein